MVSYVKGVPRIDMVIKLLHIKDFVTQALL